MTPTSEGRAGDRRAVDRRASGRRASDRWNFLAGDTRAVARRLLGAVIESTAGGSPTSGRIVETEAYLGPGDPASHAHSSKGRTPRNDAMFGPRGTLYVYLSHGIHHCANVVTGRQGDPSAILIRALEPLDGLEVMAARRGRSADLCSGPGRLTQALGITLSHNRHDLSRAPVRLLPGAPAEKGRVGVSGRINVSKASDWPLRYFVRGHPAVKSPRW